MNEDKVVFHVDVGNLSPELAAEHIKKVREQLGKKQAQQESKTGTSTGPILLQE